jgi:large subunit ribosomal protein L25
MKIAELKAESRTVQGSAASRKLRRQGLVPGILYGHGEEVLKVSLPAEPLRDALESGQRLLTLRLGDRQERALVKEVQFDTWGREILHVDFSRVALDETVNVSVEVVSHGTPKAALEGGVLEQPLRRVQIACKADAIPDRIRVEVEHLETNDKIQVKDLRLPEGVKVLDDPDAIVFIVKEAREEVVAAAAPAAEVTAAEPEVIGRAAKEAAAAEAEAAEAEEKGGKGKEKAK